MERPCRHRRVVEQGAAGRFCGECGQRVEVVAAEADRAPGEVETVRAALGWIADRAKYLAEPAWTLEGCALVGKQMYERANEARTALDAFRGRSRDDTVTLAETAEAFVRETPVTHPLIGQIGPQAPAAIRYDETRGALLEALARFGGAGRPETQEEKDERPA